MEKNNSNKNAASKQQVINNGNKAKAFKPAMPSEERLLQQYGFVLEGIVQKRIDISNEKTYAGKKLSREGDTYVLECFQNVKKEGKLTTIVVARFKGKTKDSVMEAFTKWFATWKDQTAYSYEGFMAPDGFGGKWQTLYEEAVKKGRLHDCIARCGVKTPPVTIEEAIKA